MQDIESYHKKVVYVISSHLNETQTGTEGRKENNFELWPFNIAAAWTAPGGGGKISNVLRQASSVTQRYAPDLIPASSSCSPRLSDPSGSSCGLVETQSPSQGCRGLKSHLRPSGGPYWGRTGICPPSATPFPALLLLLLHHCLHRSSSRPGRAHGTGQTTWSWSVSAFVCGGSSGCGSKVKRRGWFWWSRAWLGSACLCFSRCKCWWQERPPTRPRWRRGRRSKRTSRSCSGFSCPRPSCHWDRRRCSRCRRWCRWCCSGLETEVRQGQREGDM